MIAISPAKKKRDHLPLPVPTADELGLAQDFANGLVEVVGAFAGGAGSAGGREIVRGLTIIFSADASGNELQYVCQADGAIVNVSSNSSAWALSLNVSAVIRSIGAQTVYDDQIISTGSTSPGGVQNGIAIFHRFNIGDIIKFKMSAGSACMTHVFCILYAPRIVGQG